MFQVQYDVLRPVPPCTKFCLVCKVAPLTHLHLTNRASCVPNVYSNRLSFSTVSDLEPLLSRASIPTRASTLSILSALPSPTNLQVAALAYSLYNGTRLTKDGCTQQDGFKNCTAVCQNMTQVFSSMDTLQNCLAFPAINNILSTVNTTNEYRNLAREYGITGEDPKISFGVVNQISRCLASYCSQTSNCYAPTRTLEQGNGSDMSCANIQNSDHFPITLSAFPSDYKLGIIFCDADNATIYIGDDGQQKRYGGEVTDRHAYCNTSLTVNGTAIPRARLEDSRGTFGCISSICNGVSQLAFVNSEIGGIGVCYCYN